MQMERPIIDEAVREATESISLIPTGTVNSAVLLSNGRNNGSFLNAKYVLIDFDKSLPNAAAIGALPANMHPDEYGKYNIGHLLRAWKDVVSNAFTICKKPDYPGQPAYQYRKTYSWDDWFNDLGHTFGSTKFVMEGYGAHKYYDSEPVLSIGLVRPVPFETTYGNILTWTFDGWWSPYDISNVTGVGIKRKCIDSADADNPGVEFEVDDTGNDEVIYIRFRNFHPNRVVVGVRVIA